VSSCGLLQRHCALGGLRRHPQQIRALSV